MYQLTPFLTAVAGCSTTIIAIIGGFMVRKLIAISAEQHDLTAKLDEEQRKLAIMRHEHKLCAGRSPEIEGTAPVSEDELKLQTEKIAWLQGRLESIRNPVGMKRGLLIFVFFSFQSVLVPLALVPFETDSLLVYWTVKLVILLFLAMSMAEVYFYVLYLMHWTNKEVLSRWLEYLFPWRKQRKEPSQSPDKQDLYKKDR